MKILFDPVYTNRSIARCATYYALHEMARFAVRQIPDTYAYIVAPSNTDAWDLDDLDPDERIRYVHLPMSRDRYKELLYVSRDWVSKFAYWGEFYDWDVLVSTRVPSLMQVRLCIERDKKCKHIVAFEPFPIVETKRTVTLFNELGTAQLLTLGGYAVSDLCAVNTQHEIDGILEVGRKLLSPAVWSDLKGKLACKYILPLGCDPQHALEKKASNSKEWRLVLYPQRLDKTERRPELVMETLRYAFVQDAFRGQKVPIEFEVCTNSAGIGSWDERMEFVRFRQPPREEFYRRLQQADVFVSFALEEGIPLSLLEALCFGVIGVVKRERWSVDMFGPEYPWLVGGIEEAVAAIKSICDDYVSAYRMFRRWMREDFVPKMERRWDYLPWWAGFLKKWESERVERTALRQIDEIVLDAVKDREEMVLGEEMIELAEKRKVRFSYNRRLRREKESMISLFKRDVDLNPVRRAMLANGWTDASARPGHLKRSR